MYNCDVHGICATEWCNDCQKIIKCDHSDMITDRFNLEYHYTNGTRNFQLVVESCETCGENLNPLKFIV